MPPPKLPDYSCISYLKCALHVYNFIFLLSGFAVLGIGIWALQDKYQYISLLDSVTYSLAAIVLIVAGCIVIIAAILGCFVFFKENRCYLLVYIYILLLIFLLEAMVGILSYVYVTQVDSNDELKSSLNTTFMENYSIDMDTTEAINNMQQEFKCCGAENFEDWKHSYWFSSGAHMQNLVPDSCCKTITKHCGVRDHPNNVYYSGCIHRLSTEMKDHLNIMGAVGLGICALEIFGMIFGCWLYIKLKDVDAWNDLD